MNRLKIRAVVMEKKIEDYLGLKIDIRVPTTY